ncbi:MAG: hypothetical protein J3Q66DRAFT_411217 [Benniella sp.]|nr:MAG: hypothetical protein J3Q66DRAFT_411217 [Benniella sp.]
MVFNSDLSLKQTLELVKLVLANARGTKDSELALELSFINLGTLQDSLGRSDKAQASFKKAVQWGGNVEQPIPASNVKSGKNAPNAENGQSFTHLSQPASGDSGAMLSQDIFTENVNPPAAAFSPPQVDERLNDIRQLAACLSLLQSSHSSNDVLEPVARNWIQDDGNNADEQERLEVLATQVVREYARDEIKDAKAIAEVVCLVPALENDDFQFLLRQFYSMIDQSNLLNAPQLQGLADLIRGADPGYLGSDDLIKILELLSGRLTNTQGHVSKETRVSECRNVLFSSNRSGSNSSASQHGYGRDRKPLRL